MSFSHAKKSPRDYGAGYRDELERFKTAINLTEYAASQGYQLDKRASSRNSVVMRHPAGDKIVIARGEDQHWIYFSVRDDSDNGIIIDFIQHRRRCSLGDVRRELRPWIGGAVARPAPELYVPEVVPVSRDRAGVIRALAAMKPLVTHRYLEEERAIPRELLANPRFAGRVLVDARSNVDLSPRRPGRPLRLRDQEPRLHRLRPGRGEGALDLRGPAHRHRPGDRRERHRRPELRGPAP